MDMKQGLPSVALKNYEKMWCHMHREHRRRRTTCGLLGLLVVSAGLLFVSGGRGLASPPDGGPEANGIHLGELSEGVRAFAQRGKMGFMDAAGQVLLPPTFDLEEPQYSSLPRFQEGRCPYWNRGRDPESGDTSKAFGFLDTAFRPVIPARYTWNMFCAGFPPSFSGGRAIVPVGESYQLIDPHGTPVGPPFRYHPQFLDACYYYPEVAEGLVAVSDSQRRMGYLDAASGQQIIPFRFSLAGPFSEGLAAVELDGTHITFIDRRGRQAVDATFRTTRKGLRKTEDSDDPYWPPNSGEHLGGFVDGLIRLYFYDDDGAGPKVVALVDKRGRVVLKERADLEGADEARHEATFEAHAWKFGQR
jgi:hypothetical protein